jgi:quinol monooxygenase YgiN
LAAAQNCRKTDVFASSQTKYLGVTMSTVSVIVRIQLSAESAPAYAEAAKAVVAATREEAGCQWYGIAVDVADPCIVWVSEQWASQADLDAHLKTPHVAAFLEACAALEILDMEVRRYEVSSVGDLVMPE